MMKTMELERSIKKKYEDKDQQRNACNFELERKKKLLTRRK